MKIFRATLFFTVSAKLLKNPEWWKIFKTVNSGHTLFSGQAHVVQKSWIIKNIPIQWKISGQLCFFYGKCKVAFLYGGLLLVLYNYNGLVAPRLTLYDVRFVLCSGCVPCSSSAHRGPGKKAAVPIYKVLARPGQESNSGHTSTEADALTTRPRAGLQSCSKILNAKKYVSNTLQWIQGKLFFCRASASCLILNAKSIFNTVENFRANSVFLGKCKLLKILNDKNCSIHNVGYIQLELICVIWANSIVIFRRHIFRFQ